MSRSCHTRVLDVAPELLAGVGLVGDEADGLREKKPAFSQFFRGGNPIFFLTNLSLTCHHFPSSLPPALSCTTRTSSPPTDHETDSGLVGLPPATLQVSSRDSPAVAFTAEEEEEGSTETEVGAEARERRPRPLAVRTSESCKNMYF